MHRFNAQRVRTFSTLNIEEYSIFLYNSNKLNILLISFTNACMNETQLPNTPVHKIGAVASISEVPTPTLRIWEIRYGTFTPNKTLSNHRLYTDDDLLKATLLKNTD